MSLSEKAAGVSTPVRDRRPLSGEEGRGEVSVCGRPLVHPSFGDLILGRSDSPAPLDWCCGTGNGVRSRLRPDARQKPLMARRGPCAPRVHAAHVSARNCRERAFRAGREVRSVLGELGGAAAARLLDATGRVRDPDRAARRALPRRFPQRTARARDEARVLGLVLPGHSGDKPRRLGIASGDCGRRRRGRLGARRCLEGGRPVRGESRKWILEYPSGTRLFASDGRIANAKISPDGREVAFELHPSVDAEGEVDVAIRGGGTRTVSAGWKSVNGLAWSTSGEEILLTASKKGRGQSLWAVSPCRPPQSRRELGRGWSLEDVTADGSLLVTRGQLQMQMMAAGAAAGSDLVRLERPRPRPHARRRHRSLQRMGRRRRGANEVAFVRRVDGSPAIRLGEGSPAAISPDGRQALVLPSRPSSSRAVACGAGRGDDSAGRRRSKVRRREFTVFDGVLSWRQAFRLCRGGRGQAPAPLAVQVVDVDGGPRPVRPEARFRRPGGRTSLRDGGSSLA